MSCAGAPCNFKSERLRRARRSQRHIAAASRPSVASTASPPARGGEPFACTAGRCAQLPLNGQLDGSPLRPPLSLHAACASQPAVCAMFIEEIVVDGFKSYAHRTVVPSFDPFFNAITGLNGSGKSNILDSICFVLGITNLSQVRPASIAVSGPGLRGQAPADARTPPARLGPRGQPAGAGVQAGAGGRDKGVRLHRLQQQRPRAQPRGL